MGECVVREICAIVLHTLYNLYIIMMCDLLYIYTHCSWLFLRFKISHFWIFAVNIIMVHM